MHFESFQKNLSSTFGRGVGGKGFRVTSENKETPEPLNRKRSRKGFRGQQGQVAGCWVVRQIFFQSFFNPPIVT